MAGYGERVFISEHSPQKQELLVHEDPAFTAGPGPDSLERQIHIAREECKQLYNQINLVKSKIQDADLQSMSRNIARITEVNLKPTTTLKGHNNKVTDFKWSSDSKSILSASQDGFMLLWDAATGLKRNAIPLNSQWVLTCALCPNGNLAASAGLDNNCTIYRISQQERVVQNIVSIFKGHTCYISDVEFLDDKSIVSASGDMTCALWDITKSKRISEFADHLGDVLSISVPRNNGENEGNIFASGGSDGYLYIWDKRSQTSMQSFFVSDSDLTKIKFFKNGDTIAAGSDDGWTRLYDLRSDCQIAQYSLAEGLQNSSNPQYQTFLNPASDYNGGPSGFATGSPYSPASYTMDAGFMDNQGVISLDFSHSGRLMYTSYTDYGCAIWDLLKGEIVGRLASHSNRISGVSTSPDGLAVCTGSWDMTMKIWSAAYI
ncbi:HHL049Cp [Eremothecium sinecaudum]|uniref:HHL049Cp n=1 Tax=Eremothecium sinecaudum TaxID=45286 RepID=A0A0X8HVY4_9SACH|nr:HHL049Cp [Eremothecium sinecaudum]AMD22721.1 HHL049Cp [Eremothecium sinecaudum]